MRNKKSRYDLQSVLSMAGKLSCKRTALKRCTNIEILSWPILPRSTHPQCARILFWDFRRHYHKASEGRSVAPRRPRLVARLHRSAGGIPLSFRTWSIHLSRGRPGRRFHWSLGGRPRDRSTRQWRALCAGTSCCSLAMWPKRALRRLLITSNINMQTLF